MSNIGLTCKYKLLSPAKIFALIQRTWQHSGIVSVPVGTHLFQAVSQACLFSHCSSTHGFLVLSSVGTPPLQPRQQSAHTGKAALWAGWETEGETEGGGGLKENMCVSVCVRQERCMYQCSCLLYEKWCTQVNKSRQLCVLMCVLALE